MIQHVAAAFDRQDYKTAAHLLKQLWQESPDNPWVRLYMGRLQEVSGNAETAETTYRLLLQETTNPKIVTQARQGLQRLEAASREQRQQAIAQATADPLNSGIGFLVIEPLSSEARIAAAPLFARIMNLDPYTARLHLPSRGWRLYRTGAVGEMQIYSQDLCKANIPAFSESLANLQAIRVFRVQYIDSASPTPTVVCQNETDQVGSLTFDWSEVTNRVEGLLPVFEDVVDTNVRNQLTRKEQTQDYAQVCDLHLPGRNAILRLIDTSYQFQQGVVFDASQDGAASLATTRIRWNMLLRFLDSSLPNAVTWSDFTVFAETALEHLDLLVDFNSYITLFRKQPSNWDPAFHLYSGLVFRYSLRQ
ncbi:tetratricopeptide repeat protein [Oculatella sp. LEGE 06141]|uniref:tetratricopeptide repeat protein n=1 Tax=Oculatella sp. LEGE 06141 TaxID=1828648 RepID=UPI00187E5EB2|nr:tetratricopeptide repeat protein [Oculatella sp. LEGE 06141]MBE9178433.1 tetratricopeptide repeat protein [Oculatella sp. LEGE 06141]